MRFISVVCTVVVLSCLSRCAGAAEMSFERISLESALARAVLNNAELRRARAQVRSSDALLLSARGVFDLEFELGGSFSRRVTPRLAPDDFRGGVWDQNAYQVELRRRLETGGRVALEFNGSAETTNSRLDCGTNLAPAGRCVLQSTGASLSLTQPLLRGAGTSVVFADIRRREVQHDIATLSRLATASVVVRDIVTAYGQLAFAHEVLGIQRSAHDLAQEQRRSTEKQVQVGKRAPIDVAAAEQAVSGASTAVLFAEEQILSRTLALRELLGVDNPVPVSLLATEPGSTRPVGALDVKQLIDRSLARNPELQARRLGQRLSDVELAASRSLLWPQLDLEASVGTVGRSRDAVASFRQAGSLSNTAWFVGFTFGFPVQNRQARGRLENARAERDRVEVDIEAQAREIRNQIVRLVNALQSGSKRIEFARKTISFAELNLKAEKTRFGLGHATNNDVLRVQQDLRESQLTLASATLELMANQAALQALTGEILEHHKISIQGVD